MREIACKDITAAVKGLCLTAAYDLIDGLEDRYRTALQTESSPLGRYIIEQLLANLAIARSEQVPVCQDTGIAVLFVTVGQEVHITGGDLTAALNEGVRQGYAEGYLRKSMLDDPLFERKNTGDNTPAMISYDIMPGDRLTIQLMPKGGGSENVGALAMLKPSDGVQGVKDFVVEAVIKGGGSPCPPVIVGVGIGGSMDKAALLAKKALRRPPYTPNPDARYAELEAELLQLVNDTGLGPEGLGGNTTAVAVQIEQMPTHMACLPVAVNIGCNASRLAAITL